MATKTVVKRPSAMVPGFLGRTLDFLVPEDPRALAQAATPVGGALGHPGNVSTSVVKKMLAQGKPISGRAGPLLVHRTTPAEIEEVIDPNTIAAFIPRDAWEMIQKVGKKVVRKGDRKFASQMVLPYDPVPSTTKHEAIHYGTHLRVPFLNRGRPADRGVRGLLDEAIASAGEGNPQSFIDSLLAGRGAGARGILKSDDLMGFVRTGNPVNVVRRLLDASKMPKPVKSAVERRASEVFSSMRQR